MSVTYFVAPPFTRSEEGDLVPGEAKECPSAHSAEREAFRVAAKSAWAVAFSRTGDPPTGEFDDAVVLRRSHRSTSSLKVECGVRIPQQARSPGWTRTAPRRASWRASRADQGIDHRQTLRDDLPRPVDGCDRDRLSRRAAHRRTRLFLDLRNSCRRRADRSRRGKN
jgi:hypothetical protein